ncbi:hypothetical protein MKX47_11220 [Solibacillus sp. FSL R7-0668]|uniref:hypothetical protein n=1 Tax=Solibacillus sp. FSL R7-0668 TaxID=2921688 RepID=UPI0030FB5ED4
MNYKKLLAATAMTSAAFVVPVMVGAEEIVSVPKDDLIADGTYSVGDTVKAALTEIKTSVDAGDGTTTETVDKIVSYEWFVGDATTASSKTAEFKLPMHAEEKKIKLVVTTEGKKKYFEEIPVEALDTFTADVGYEEGFTSPRVNTIITMKNLNILDKDEVISAYEWYLMDGGQYKLLVGENAIDLQIPIEFSGKEILFVVRTESGKVYKIKENVKIEELKFGLNPVTYSVKVNGKLTELSLSNELLPGDQIQIGHSEIIGDGGEILSAEDYEVHYKWVAFNGNDNQFTLPNATGNTFTIPVDSEKQGYKRFEVTVTISVPGIVTANGELTVDSELIEIGTNNKPITTLISDINKLIEKTSYTDLQNEVNKLLADYNQLNDRAKATITNYAKLDEYVQGFKVVDPLTKEFDKLYTDYKNFKAEGNSTVKQAELLKSMNSLRQSYNILTAKQREIYKLFETNNAYPSIAQLYELIVKIDDKHNTDYVTNEAVEKFNEKVAGNIFKGEYKINYVDPSNELEELTAFEATIKQYLDEVKTFDKAYQPLLKTDVLKTAQADVKKVRVVIEKINKISTQTGKKKASAIIAAEKAYNKLNIAQATLISDSTKEKLFEPFTADEEQSQEDAKLAAQDLIVQINDILPAGAGKEYSLDIELLESELADIAAKYKLLTSDQKKLVTNYKSVSQVKRDVSAAKRVAMSVIKAEEAEAEATSYDGDENRSKYISKMKSAHSKYNSAYKAYTKLTIEQKSLVDGDALKSAIASITAIIDDEEFAGKDEYDSGKSSEVVSQIEKIAELLKTAEDAALADSGGIDTDADLQQAINTAKSMYKSLNSFEKKLVHNYALISTASSHLSKASSVKKRLLAASDEKKFISAKKSFDKLQPVQQGLIFETYADIRERYTSSDSSGSSTLQELGDLLTGFFEDGSYDIVVFKEIQTQLQPYSSKELKTLTNYKKYQELVKDVRAVDSFVAKMVKLGENPTYSQKDSIYKSYLKLTRVQQQLLGTYKTPDAIVDEDTYSKKLFEWMEAAEGASTDLNSRIGAIIVSGKYSVILDGASSLEKLADFEQQLDDLTKEYKALDSKERKLVVNYSYIKNAEKDLKAVRAVIQLEEKLANAEDKSPIEQAKNRLTVEQKSLYDLVQQP